MPHSVSDAFFPPPFLLCCVFASWVSAHFCSRPIVSGGGTAEGQAPPPWKPLSEEGNPSPSVPTSLEGVANLLSGLSEHQYGVGVATMAYTAQRAKMSKGVARQQWTELFIDSFKYVYGDILGDPQRALGLC